MKYLGILTSARTAPEFIGTEPVQRATWLCLMLFCAEHETGGVINGCRSWGDRRWMQTCGVTKAEVMVDSTLFHFVGDDLTVWGYQDEYEASVLARREAGRKAGLRSAEVRSKQRLEPQVEPQVERSLKPQVEPKVERKDRIGEERIGFKSVRTGVGSDKYEAVQSIPQSNLAQWAAEFCGDDLYWVRFYKSAISKIGPEAFRSILSQFVGEIGAGEGCRNRGSALVSKLKDAVAAKSRKAVAS